MDTSGNPERIVISDAAFEENTTKAAQKFLIKNGYGENLVGILHEFDSKNLVILCHGFQSSKEGTISKVSEALVTNGISNFCFDFSGNGESDGPFQFGNYWKEVEDLRAVVLYFLGQKYHIGSIVGHSKGGNVVLLYASKYHDISTVINLSGRFDMTCGLECYLGKNFLPRIKADGFIDVVKKNGERDFRVTEENLSDRLNVNMHDASLLIAENCRVLTVHGSEDEAIPVGDAFEFAKLIPNHTLRIIEGSDHCYTRHQAELNSAVLEFLSEVEYTIKIINI